jgi:glycosyltransferase involved in cell wall biosynthesis
LITTIVPCYKCANTIEATLNSVLNQGVSSHVIALDDGSPDQTLEVLKSFEGRAQILTGPNQGVSGTRNKGIGLIQDDWVQFIDSDDLLAPETWADRLACAEKSGADVIVTDWADFTDDRQIAVGNLNQKSTDWARLHQAGAEVACATSFWAPPAAVLYRRWVVDKIGRFRTDLPIIQDARFLFDAAFVGAKFAHVPKIGAYYRIVDHSLSRSNPAKFWRDVLTNIKQIENLWQTNGGLSDHAQDALLEVYSSAANSLLRCGDASFKQAEEQVRRLGGSLNFKYQIGSALTGLLGPSATASLFQFGRTLPVLTQPLKIRP